MRQECKSCELITPDWSRQFSPEEIRENLQNIARNLRALLQDSPDPIKKGKDTILPAEVPNYLFGQLATFNPSKGREMFLTYLNGERSRTYLWVQYDTDSWGLTAKDVVKGP